MPIDLLPFSAFALESSGAPAQAVSEPQTLTLRLAPLALHGMRPAPMSGTVLIEAAAPNEETSLRACVIHGDASALTLTF
jgi:hypothetical protein